MGLIEDGWAYEMQLERQNGRWVVAQLRLFPDSGELELKRLILRTKFDISVGTIDEAAISARKLAHLARAQPQPKRRVAVPPGGLTTRHLRRIPFGRSSGTSALAELDSLAEKLASIHRRRADLDTQEKALDRTVKGLRRGDARLAQIASCYVKVLGEGSRRANVEVARQLQMKVSQVRDAVHLARKNGLLTAARKQGAPEGELTPKAIALLKGLTRELTETDKTPNSRPSKKLSTETSSRRR